MPTSSCSGGQVEDLRRRLGVHVLAALEDLAQHVLAGDVGEHAQLDLRSSRPTAARCPARRRSSARISRPVSVRIGMFCRFGLIERQAPGRRRRLREGRVQAPVVASMCGGQRVEVGLRELGELAEALDLRDDRVLVADRLQHARVGREAGLAAALARQAELLEEDRAELLRGADDELLAGELPDLALERPRTLRRSGRATGASRSVSSRMPSISMARSTRTSGSSMSVQQVHRGRARRAARAGSSASASDQRRARRGAGRRRRPPGRAPRASSCERVAAPRRVEQVGAELRVEDEVRRAPRRAPWRRGRRRARSPAAAASSAGSATCPASAGPLPPQAAKRQRGSAGEQLALGDLRARSTASATSAPGSVADVAPPCPALTGSASAVVGLRARDRRLARRPRAPPRGAAADRAARSRGTSRAAASGRARGRARARGRSSTGTSRCDRRELLGDARVARRG